MDSTRSGLKWGVESAESTERWTKANPADEELGTCSRWTLRGRRGRHAEKERPRKLGTARRPLRPASAGTALAPHITRQAGKLRRVGE